jgi:hypothetical protein
MNKERIIKNWVTTIIGVSLIGISVWFVVIDKMPWWGLIPMGTFGGWFMYAKDSTFKKAFEKLSIFQAKS